MDNRLNDVDETRISDAYRQTLMVSLRELTQPRPRMTEAGYAAYVQARANKA